MDLINLDRDAEELISKAKQSEFGYLMKSELDANIFSVLAKEKLLNYNLIVQSKDRTNMYVLTERGWNFQSFEDEQQKNSHTLEKLRLEVEALRNQTSDYPKTKSRAKTAIRLTWLAVILSVLLPILQWMCNKPD